jgi:putative transposase
MARPPRYSLAGQPHHVIQRGNNRATTFHAEEDFRFYYENLRSVALRCNCLIHAYVFMTNHVHLLLTPADAGAIGVTMRSLGIRYAMYFNRRYGRTGSLYESRYRSAVVDSTRYLFTCYRYIEENPVRAGMTNEPSAYGWSSYRANALGEENVLLTQHEQFIALGRNASERQLAYRALFRNRIDQDALTTIRYATNRGVRIGETDV